MTRYRWVFDDMPAKVEVPPELRHRRVEVVLSPLDESSDAGSTRPVDESGWPAGFFDQTAGRWSGEPLTRETEGEYETREELE